MRIVVDLPYGYISYDISEEEKAYRVYDDPQYNAIRVRLCKDIFDEGTVVRGLPIVEDLTHDGSN